MTTRRLEELRQQNAHLVHLAPPQETNQMALTAPSKTARRNLKKGASTFDPFSFQGRQSPEQRAYISEKADRGSTHNIQNELSASQATGLKSSPS